MSERHLTWCVANAFFFGGFNSLLALSVIAYATGYSSELACGPIGDIRTFLSSVFAVGMLVTLWGLQSNANRERDERWRQEIEEPVRRFEESAKACPANDQAVIS